MEDFPPRHAISRARFFLQKAEQCTVQQRDECEAYLEAAIVFARTALLRLQWEYEKHPKWKSWWDGLLANVAVCFIRVERNCIIHERPPKIGQVIRVGQTSGLAADLYYYESPDIPATDTIKRHLDEIAKLILEGQTLFVSTVKADEKQKVD